MTACDMREECAEVALYRVWLVGPHADGSDCDGHPTCATCTALIRAGRRPVTAERIESLREAS